VVAVKVHAVFFAAALASGLLLRRGREESTGTSKPSVVETNVVHSVVSKASLADVGLMVPSHDPVEVAGLRVVGLFFSTRRVDSGPWPCVSGGDGAGVAPQNACRRSADARPLIGASACSIAGETALRRNWAGPSGLLVLGAGRRRGGNLTPLECL